MISRVCFLVLFLFSSIFLTYGQSYDGIFNEFSYRNFSPHLVGSWISDIAVPENPDDANKYTFYVAARNGGVWKTINNGVTFFPVFERYGNVSIGAIEVSKSDPEVIWVGTGEASCARMAHSGNGIYKSDDGGTSFKLMGLADSHHIARILIHPENSNIVYVAVMGHLFTPNSERGVFKTVDGGENWVKILYIDENTGIVDLVINPEDPEILYAASYEKYRFPWHYEAGGKESGIYKTINGGKTWERLGGGLPLGNIGRIGLDIYKADPTILYAVIENLNTRPDFAEPNTEGGSSHLRDDYFDRFIAGEVYRTGDAGNSWRKMNSDSVNVSGKAAYSFNQIMVDPNDENNLFITGVSLQTSHDKGQTWSGTEGSGRRLFRNMFGDVRTFWINPADSRHIMAGSDGGIYVTYDGGKSMHHFYHIPLGEMYSIEYDMDTPYNIYAGLQDHEGWKAPSNGPMGEISSMDWKIVGMWDGMYHAVDKTDSRWLYFTTQFGAHHRVDQQQGERIKIEPVAEEDAPPYRYTWNTPLVISPHNSSVLYTGGQMLLRSEDKGNTWKEISPDLTLNDQEKINGKGHIMYCTITTISESPVKQGVIWIGTDDGHVQITKDNGKNWTNVSTNIEKQSIPKERWVSRVFASNHNPAVAYITKTGFRNDDFSPYVLVTEDYGKSWKNISSNLPNQSVSVIIEDDVNPDLLFIGNETGVYFSLNKGKEWIPFNQNMPSVPIKDMKIHPRDRDLITASYGRGAWVTDIYPFLELSPKTLNKEFHLFNIEPKPQLNFSQQAFWGNNKFQGDSHLYTPNEENGIVIYYYLKENPGNTIFINIEDTDGNILLDQKLDAKTGINKFTWNTFRVKPGEYNVRVNYNGQWEEKPANVLDAWKWKVGER